MCQVCGKEGHGAARCFKRFDENFTGPPSSSHKSASSATTSYGVDTNWYMDSSVTDHITRELNKLTVCDSYTEGDQVHAANGSGMEIDYVGHSTLHSQNHTLHLNNILHVPQSSKRLVYVHRFTRDNNAYLEFHPDHFLLRTNRCRNCPTLVDVKAASIHSSPPQINKASTSSSRC